LLKSIPFLLKGIPFFLKEIFEGKFRLPKNPPKKNPPKKNLPNKIESNISLFDNPILK